MTRIASMVALFAVFCTGTLLAQTAGDYRSFQTGDWSAAASWETFDGANWIPATTAPTGSENITIQTGHTITVDIAVSGVTGYIKNQGALTIGAGSLAFSTGTYEHAINGGTIPTATWGTGSTCIVSGATSSDAGNANQNFHHFTWNSPGQSANRLLAMNGNTIGGNLTITNTGTTQLRFSSTTGSVITINGNVIINGGFLTTTGSGGVVVTVNVGGDINLSSGTLGLVQSSGTGTWNLGGDFIMSGGTLQKGSGPGVIVFDTPGVHMLNRTGGTMATANGGPGFAVSSGAILDLGESNINAGAFTLNASGTLRTSHASGLNGNLTSAGTITLSTGAHYTYNGTVAQVTGALLPATVSNLTINNAAGVTLSGSTTVNGTFARTAGSLALGTFTLGYGPAGTLEYNGTAAQTTEDAEFPSSGGPNNLTIDNAAGVSLHASRTIPGTVTFDNGKLSTGANTLTIGESGAVVGAAAGKYVDGKLARAVPSSGSPTVPFDIGDATNYTPVSVAFNTLTAGGTITSTTTGTEHPNIAGSGIDASKSVNRYWTLTNTTTAFTNYSATFNFVAGDVDGGANPANFSVGKYDDPTWSMPAVGTRTATSTEAVGLTSFSDFAIGEPAPVAGTILSNGTGGGDWASTTTWQGGVVPTAVDSVVILGSDSVFVLASVSSAGLSVQGKLGLTANVSAANITIAGKVSVHADSLLASGDVTVTGTGIYHHGRNGGRIPTTTWESGSTILITNVTTTSPQNGNQNFHHIIWNCETQTSNLNMGWNNNTIGGNITILNTSTGRWQMTAPATNGSATVTIMGDVNQSGGNFSAHGTGNGGTTIVIDHHGNINVTGGNFSIARGGQGGTGTTTWNLLGGDFSMSNATTQNSNAAGARFIMAGAGAQSVTFANDSLGSTFAVPIRINGGSITTLALTNINYAGRGFPIQVNSNATVKMGTTVFAGNGTFTLDSAATLESGHADGLNGNLATTGTKTLSTDANYVFNGSAAQVTGALLPGSVASLTIDNAAGVTLSDTTTATGALNLTHGALSTGANLMAVASGGVVNRVDGHVNGNLQKTVASPSDSRTFEIGDASTYTPVLIAGTSYTSPFNVVASTTTGDHPNIGTSGIDATKSVNRYYTLGGSPTGPSDITFNFAAGDVDPGANTGNFNIEKYDASWTALTVGTRTATSTQAIGVADFSDFAIGEPPAAPPSVIMSNGTGGGEWSSGTTWAGGVPPGVADTVVIVGTDSVYVSNDAASAALTVQSSAKLALLAKLSIEDVTLNGKISVHADSLHESSMTVSGTGVYEHARNGGRLPIATWNSGSTILFTGITANAPSNGNQDFHHVIWNSPAQTSNLNLGWNGNTISGNITVISTGPGRWQLCAPLATDTSTVTIMGDVIQTGGNFTTNGTGNGFTTIVIDHHGNIVVTGGNFSISRGSQGGTGTSSWNILGGNFSMSNATTQNSNAAGARFVFAGSSAQTLALDNVTFAGGGLPIAINSGATVNSGLSVIRGSGAFTVNDNATLATGHPGGLDSLLQNTGTRTLSTNAGYGFNGTAAQITGSLLPDTVLNLAVNNAAGVTLSGGTTVNSILSVASGDLDLNGNTVTLGPSGMLAETPGNTVTGATGVITTTRTLSSPSDTANIAGLGVRIGSSANLGSTVIARGHGVQTAGGGSIKRYFDITPTNNTGLNATLRFMYDQSELDGANEATLELFRSTDGGSSWTQRGGAVDTTANVITLAGIAELSRWTASPVTLPPLPAQVVLVSPAHGALISADSAACVWHQSTPAVTNYWFERATDSLFTANVIVDSTLTDTSTVTRGLMNNQTYWWRVRAKNAAGYGPYSDARRFLVSTTGVAYGNEAPIEFSLKQNYPNPFNPATTITFSVEQTGQATLDVYNILGQKVMTLFDGMAEAGQYHHVRLDGSNLSSGIYFYRLQSGQKSDLKKLILLK
jgi:hypothetical protein